MPPCLKLSFIRKGSRVKWKGPGKGVAYYRTLLCSSYWKGSFRVTFHSVCQLYFITVWVGVVLMLIFRVGRLYLLGKIHAIQFSPFDSTNLRAFLVLEWYALFTASSDMYWKDNNKVSISTADIKNRQKFIQLEYRHRTIFLSSYSYVRN